MAEKVAIAGTDRVAKVRTPWVVLLLGFVTLGIYLWFWWYFVNRELTDLGRARGTTELGTTPILSALAYSIGGLVYIPWIWTIVTTTRRIQAAQRLVGQQNLNGWLAAMMWILTFGIGGIVYTQSELNQVWTMQRFAEARERTAAPGGGAAPGSPRLRKLEQLRDTGALSAVEFDAERSRLGL